MTKRLALAAAALLLSAATASAADDPIAQRKALMDANAGAAGLSAGLMKGEIDYNPAVAKAAILTFRAVADTYGSFFPAGSDKGQTKASPKIWEDAAGFQQHIDKFKADAEKAAAAAGEDGPADLEAFKAAAGPVLANCKSCHEAFRLK